MELDSEYNSFGPLTEVENDVRGQRNGFGRAVGESDRGGANANSNRIAEVSPNHSIQKEYSNRYMSNDALPSTPLSLNIILKWARRHRSRSTRLVERRGRIHYIGRIYTTD
jgi:hypothetical protein